MISGKLHCWILADIVDQHAVILHAFADYTQMYLHCHRDDLQSAAAQLELCISEDGLWMAASRLKINTDNMDRIQGQFSSAKPLFSGTTPWSRLYSRQ